MMEMLTEGMNFEFCDLEKVPERSFVAVRKSARSSRKVLKQLPILLNEDQQQHLSTRTNWRKNNFLNEQRHFQKNEQDFQVVEKSAPGQIPLILQEMKENMDVITDKDIQDLDKSKSEKQSGNAEISAQIERHMEHKSVKSNVLPSDKRASIVGDDHSCVSTVASVKNSEYLVTEDKYSHPADKSFSTPKKCSDFPCDSEQLITEASKEVLKSPIDFTTVTVADFGITPEIFTIKSSGNANKSLQKARRRSTIGVRGSPETNFLIRYIAQQRSNSKKESVAQ
ncbi:uncharacterized protein LOC115459309, partial [Microcaecilia unicolor]|uniref:Uncharacterized protein LOC115459309 n=1 Tax=Microcaecilia unicolor TaxID=1415580 RepID=A0A6P7X389_9AMPH